MTELETALREVSLQLFLSAFFDGYRAAKRIQGALDCWARLVEQECNEMARNAKKVRPDVQFVNIRLSRDKKDEFAAWVVEGLPELFDELGNLAEAGYKFGVSFDHRNNCFIASLTCWVEKDSNYGYCFSTRHADVRTALELMVYKALIVLEDADWKDGAENDDWG